MRTPLSALLLVAIFGCGPATEPSPDVSASLPTIAPEVLLADRDGNARVIQALAGANSNLSLPHAIEYHFLCDSADQVEAIRKWGSEAGFEPANLNLEGDPYFGLDLVKSTVPDLEAISADSARMLQAAAMHGGSYDGWGCSVVE